MCEEEIDTSDKVSKSRAGRDGGGRPMSVAAMRAYRTDVFIYCSDRSKNIVCFAIRDTGNVH